MAFDWLNTLGNVANWAVQNQQSNQQQNATNAANQAAANASLEAAKIAAQESRFRPVGMTNAFGTSNFTTDKNGFISGASYELNPYLQATLGRLQQGLPGQLAGAEAAQGASGSLFNLGQQYLATSPQQAAQDWLKSQQALLQPARDQEYAKMQQNLANAGRGGLSIAQGGNLQNTNPEMAAYYNAVAQQDAQLAANADKYGMERTNYGASLFDQGLKTASGAYAPLTSNLQASQGVNDLGQTAFNLGTALGGKNVNPSGASALANAGATQASYLQNVKPYTTNYGSLSQGLFNNQWSF